MLNIQPAYRQEGIQFPMFNFQAWTDLERWFRQAQPPRWETLYERSHFETDSYRRPPQCDTSRNALITLFSVNLCDFSVLLCVIY